MKLLVTERIGLLLVVVLFLSKFHSRVVAHYSCRSCWSLLISLLHFSSLECQSLAVRRHRTNNCCDMFLMCWEKPHVSNWCDSNKWWIMQCMNLQLSNHMTTALTTSHGSRVARTIRSSYPAMVQTSKTDHFLKLAPFRSPLTDLIDFGIAFSYPEIFSVCW